VEELDDDEPHNDADDADEDPDDDDDPDAGSYCPICSESYCCVHVVVEFVDGHVHEAEGVLTLDVWNGITRELQERLIEAWLEGWDCVATSKGLSSLLALLPVESKDELLQAASGEKSPYDPGSFSLEVLELLEEKEELPEVDQIIRDALDSLRGLTSEDASFDKGPCTFESE